MTTKATAVQIINAMGSQLEQAIPEGGPRPAQYQRMMIALLKKNEGLRECSPVSIQNVALEVAQLGLLPDNTLGQAYVLPYRNKGVLEAQYILGYRGMIELCCRGGDISKVEPRCVHEGDSFSYEYGLTPNLRHVPSEDGEEDRPLTHAYVVWHYRDPSVSPSFYVMGKKKIDKVKGRSKSKGFSPWKSDYDAMAMKSVIRNSAKYQRVSIQALHAIQHDEQRDLDINKETPFHSSNQTVDDNEGIFTPQAEAPAGPPADAEKPASAVLDKDGNEVPF